METNMTISKEFRDRTECLKPDVKAIYQQMKDNVNLGKYSKEEALYILNSATMLLAQELCHSEVIMEEDYKVTAEIVTANLIPAIPECDDNLSLPRMMLIATQLSGISLYYDWETKKRGDNDHGRNG